MGLFTTATQQSQKSPSKAPLLEDGSYPARIARIIDLGKQPGSDKYPEPAFKMRVTFELLNEYMKETTEDGQPIMVQDPDEDEGVMMEKDLLDKPRWFDFDFTYNQDGFMGDNSHIFKFMKAVDALEVKPNPEQGIEGHPAIPLNELLGAPLNVGLIRYVKKGGKRAGETDNKITTFSPMKSKEKRAAKELVNPTLFFNLGEPDLEVFNKLPGGESPYAVKNIITSNLDFKGSKLDVLLGGKPAPVQVNAASESQVDEAMQKELEAQREAAAARAAAAATDGEDKPAIPF